MKGNFHNIYSDNSIRLEYSNVKTYFWYEHLHSKYKPHRWLHEIENCSSFILNNTVGSTFLLKQIADAWKGYVTPQDITFIKSSNRYTQSKDFSFRQLYNVSLVGMPKIILHKYNLLNDFRNDACNSWRKHQYEDDINFDFTYAEISYDSVSHYFLPQYIGNKHDIDSLNDLEVEDLIIRASLFKTEEPKSYIEKFGLIFYDLRFTGFSLGGNYYALPGKWHNWYETYKLYADGICNPLDYSEEEPLGAGDWDDTSDMDAWHDEFGYPDDY